MLTIAAVIMLTTGIAHSYLGEKYILMRLFRSDSIPELLGSDELTKTLSDSPGTLPLSLGLA
ncbi:MAG: hypothetical protein ACI9UT_000272 [Flavobacteriales bacterium]|jgi:hypothetical protein